MADLILFMFRDHTPQTVNQYMLIPFYTKATVSYYYSPVVKWRSQKFAEERPEITVEVKMQSQEPRGGSGVSPPRKFSSFT